MSLQLNIRKLFTDVTILAAAMLQRMIKHLQCIKFEFINLQKKSICVTYANYKHPSETDILVHLQALFSESLLSPKFTSYPTEKANLADLMCYQEQKESKWYTDDKCPADDGTDHGDTCVTTNAVAPRPMM